MTSLTLQQAFILALQRHQTGRLGEAEQLYRQVLAGHPGHADALHFLGVLAHQTGHNDAATDLIRRAIAAAPALAEAHGNLGTILRDMGQLDDAIAACRQAIALRPDLAEAHNTLGNALRDKGQLDQAIAACRQATVLNPNYAEAHYSLGVALKDKGLLDEAIAAYRQAIALRPNFSDAYNNLGIVLKDAGQLDEAIAAGRLAVSANPADAAAHTNLGVVLGTTGRMDEAITSARQAVTMPGSDPPSHSNLIYALHLHPGYGPRQIAEELQRWNLRHAEPLRKEMQPHANDGSPDRRLRVGYVSPDLCDHVVGRNLLPLFRQHDRRQVEVFCYAQVPQPDAITAEFQKHADHWRDIVGLSDEQVARQIRDDRIDILVDLALHTANNRLLVLARKPAPVQATFAGYPGSTGLTAIDYRLSDPYLDPPGMDESLHSEQTLRLPDSFWCYDPLENGDIPINSPPALEKGFITFGCLNNFAKVTGPMLQLWARAMTQTANSRLIMLAPKGDHRQRTADRLAQAGIDPRRITFASPRPRRQYLELYHRIDLGLDTFPYNGHTTSLDALWMGVPVITLVGQTAVSRAGWCQLSNLGLQELAGHTADQFVTIAVELARDLPRLRELRATLRGRMQASPLMDAPRFARSIEAAYRHMWRNYCQKISATR